MTAVIALPRGFPTPEAGSLIGMSLLGLAGGVWTGRPDRIPRFPPSPVFVLLTDGLLAPWRKRDRRCNRKSFKFASGLAFSWRQPVSIFENRPKIIAEPGPRFPQRRLRAATLSC